jgi:hypothetical protein
MRLEQASARRIPNWHPPIALVGLCALRALPASRGLALFWVFRPGRAGCGDEPPRLLRRRARYVEIP